MIRHVEKVKGEVEAYIGAFDVDFFSEKSIPIIARFYLIPKTKEARAFYPLLSLSLSLSLLFFRRRLFFEKCDPRVACVFSSSVAQTVEPP